MKTPCRLRPACAAFWRWTLSALTLGAAGALAPAQELEPRAYSNAPVGLNFLIGGYAFSDGKVGVDPSIPLEDAEVEVHSTFLAYVRTLNLWGRSAKVNVALPFSWADGSAKLDGVPHERDVSGLGDPRLRFSTLFFGGPALSMEEFIKHESDFIVGGSLEVTAPLGQYDSDKLLNIGSNRWSFKPELGISKALGPFTLEFISGIRFYTDNDDFLDGRTLEVDPIYSFQGHVIYSFPSGIWVGFDALYYIGGQPTVDGNSADSLANARVGLTLSLPINVYNSVKLYGSTDVYSKTDTEFVVAGIAWQFRWGAGL